MDHTGSLVSGLSWAFPQTCRNLGITGLTDHSLTINVTECIFVRKIKVPFASCKPCFGDPRSTPSFGTCREGLASLLGDCQMRGTLSALSWLGANVCHSFCVSVLMLSLCCSICLLESLRDFQRCQNRIAKSRDSSNYFK